MLKLIKAIFTPNARKENPIAAAIELKETSAQRWWS
jgi:hypothetical protein